MDFIFYFILAYKNKLANEIEEVHVLEEDDGRVADDETFVSDSWNFRQILAYEIHFIILL